MNLDRRVRMSQRLEAERRAIDAEFAARRELSKLRAWIGVLDQAVHRLIYSQESRAAAEAAADVSHENASRDSSARASLGVLSGHLFATMSILGQLAEEDHQVPAGERSRISPETAEHLLRTIPAKIYWWACVHGMTPRGRTFRDVEHLQAPALSGTPPTPAWWARPEVRA